MSQETSVSPENGANEPRWLDEFCLFLTSRSDRLYNNGRQQIELTLLVVPAEGQAITDAQFETIGLVYQDEHGQWVELASTPETSAWFAQSDHDDRFDYYPSIVDMACPVEIPAETAARRKRLYVHCTAGASESIKVRGILTGAAGRVEYTREDLSQALYAESSPTYSFPEDYHWEQKTRVGDRLFGQVEIRSDRFLIEHALRPKSVAFSSARQISVAAQHRLRWDAQSDMSNFGSVVSIVYPDTDFIEYHAALKAEPGLSDRLIDQPLTSSQGQFVIVVQGDADLPRSLSDGDYQNPVALEAYDRFGAFHRLAIDFAAPEERVRLDIEERPDAENSDVANITYFKVSGRGLSYDKTNCRFYKNGYQQTFIEVTLEAEDSSGALIPIPQSVLNTVKLVLYENGSNLPGGYTASQSQSDIDKLFDYYEPQIATATQAPSSMTRQTIRFYVKGGTNVLGAQVAAQLTVGGKTYHTRDTTLPPGQGETQAGRSNCSAILEPMQQNYHFNGKSYYYLQMNEITPKSPVTIANRYALRLNDSTNHRIVYGSATGNLWWCNIAPGFTNTFWTYRFQQNGSTSGSAEFRGVTQPFPLPANALSQAVMVHQDTWEAGSTCYAVGVQVHPVDENGNVHQIWINTNAWKTEIYI